MSEPILGMIYSSSIDDCLRIKYHIRLSNDLWKLFMTKHPELTTIRDYIRYATSRFNEAGLFFGHGTDNAWDEAIALVFHTLHLPHHIDPNILDAHLTSDEKSKLDQLIEQRVSKRIPLSYLTHEAWFAGLSFYVDERVLIPRSPLAELIQKHFQPWIGANEPEA